MKASNKEEEEGKREDGGDEPTTREDDVERAPDVTDATTTGRPQGGNKKKIRLMILVVSFSMLALGGIVGGLIGYYAFEDDDKASSSSNIYDGSQQTCLEASRRFRTCIGPDEALVCNECLMGVFVDVFGILEEIGNGNEDNDVEADCLRVKELTCKSGKTRCALLCESGQCQADFDATYSCLTTSLLLMAGVAGCEIDPSTCAAPAQQMFVDSQTVVSYLQDISFDDGSALQTSGTPQSKALSWILETDEIGTRQGEQEGELLNPHKLVQRYVLATLWYATNGPGWKMDDWLKPKVDECKWEWKYYFPTWYGGMRRLRDYNPCNDLGELTTLGFQDNDLSGQLPEEVGYLTDLKYILFSDNRLSGTLPTQLGLLSNLSTLRIVMNKRLEGPIPTELGKLNLLDQLDLSSNNLNGQIPTHLQMLDSCEWIDLNGNSNIRGQVPKELGLMKNLEFLKISDTSLTGVVPYELCANPHLEIVSRCDLSKLVCCCCSSCCGDGSGGCADYGSGTLCENDWHDACSVCDTFGPTS